jgi:hypothetical protein
MVTGWVDQTLVGSKKIDKAAIFSAVGDALLAKSAGFNVCFYWNIPVSLLGIPATQMSHNRFN